MGRKSNAASLRSALFSWGKTIVSSVAIALFINTCLVANASVVSGSMEKTIMTGERVLFNRLAYYGKGPERFDIVFFYFPDAKKDGKTPKYLKRVIGLPGETVRIVDGKVYINDSMSPLPDDFVKGTPKGNYGPFIVPEDHYFLLGDNRNHSYDSKNWPNPFIARNLIIGKAFLSYYPNPHIVRDYSE